MCRYSLQKWLTDLDALYNRAELFEYALLITFVRKGYISMIISMRFSWSWNVPVITKIIIWHHYKQMGANPVDERFLVIILFLMAAFDFWWQLNYHNDLRAIK